jgi:hypothetical protein
MGLLTGSGNAAFKSVDRTNFYATAGQTTFTVTQGYSVGDIDVYLNGIRLVDADDYFATNGSTIVLSSGAALNDHLLVVSYNQFNAANTYSKTESDSRYMVATGQTPMSSYLRTPNYGISSWSDSANASLEASAGQGTSGVGIKAWGRSVATYGGDIHYITDTRGASGQHRFYGWNGSTWTQTMSIDASGRMNISNQPSILLNGNSSTTTFSNNQYVTQMTSEHTYGGMIWDGSLGRVTVPISGRYLISTGMYHYSTGSRRHAVMHNGTQVGLSQSSNSTTADESRAIVMVRNLSAGDWVGMQVVYGGTYYMGYAHTYFSVHLLG